MVPNKKYILSALIFFSIQYVSSQSSIGFDLQTNRDFYTLSDAGGELKQAPRINISPGIVYRYLFKNHFTIYTGIRMKYYVESVSFRKSIGVSNGGANPSLQVPLTFGRNFNLYKEKLFISPLVGASFNALLFNQPNQMGGSQGLDSDRLRYTSTTRTTQSTFITLNFGLNIEYKFTELTSVAVFFQYTKGFTAVLRDDVSYHVDQSGEKAATQTNYGNYGTYLGFRMLFHFKRKE